MGYEFEQEYIITGENSEDFEAFERELEELIQKYGYETTIKG